MFQEEYKTAFDLWYNRQKSYKKRNVSDITKEKHMQDDLYNLSCTKYSYWAKRVAEKAYLEWRIFYLKY